MVLSATYRDNAITLTCDEVEVISRATPYAPRDLDGFLRENSEMIDQVAHLIRYAQKSVELRNKARDYYFLNRSNSAARKGWEKAKLQAARAVQVRDKYQGLLSALLSVA